MRRRDKYPKLETRIKFALEYANDCPLYRVVDGMIEEVGKLAFPPRKPEDFCKTLVDCGYLVKRYKGSPWRWVTCHYTSMTWRVYPYLSENAVNTNKQEVSDDTK